MRGTEWPVWVVGMIILVILAIIIIVNYITGELKKPQPDFPGEDEFTESCRSDEDCETSLNGAKCVQIYPGGFYTFCGCISNENCVGRRNGICGSDNICR